MRGLLRLAWFRPPSARAVRHAWLTDVIREVHAASYGSYGAERVHAELVPRQEHAARLLSRGEIVRTRADSAGRYRVALSPGWCNVRTAGAPRVRSGITPRLVRVLAARFRVVNFDIDTGIR